MEHKEGNVKEKVVAWLSTCSRRMDSIGVAPFKAHPGCCAKNGMQRTKAGSKGTCPTVWSRGSGQWPACEVSAACCCVHPRRPSSDTMQRSGALFLAPYPAWFSGPPGDFASYPYPLYKFYLCSKEPGFVSIACNEGLQYG